MARSEKDGALRRAQVLSIITTLRLVGSGLEAQTPRFVPGDLVAKFVPGSEAGTTVMRAAARAPLDIEGLEPIANHLTDAVGVPLKAVALNSGYFCILSVDAKGLGERLRRRLAGRQRVERVEIVPDSAAVAVRVAFAAGATEARMPAERVAASLERELDLPLKGEALGNGRFALRVNLEALTLNLVEKLRALPEVESVQPNYILKGSLR